MDYEPLKPQYSRDGMVRRVIWRNEDIAVAETIFNNRIINYETWVISKNKAYSMAGKDFPPSESPPSTSQWGRTGFTYHSLAAAMQKANQLTSRHNEHKETAQ